MLPGACDTRRPDSYQEASSVPDRRERRYLRKIVARQAIARKRSGAAAEGRGNLHKKWARRDGL
jgi:hypothetical protein